MVVLPARRWRYFSELILDRLGDVGKILTPDDRDAGRTVTAERRLDGMQFSGSGSGCQGRPPGMPVGGLILSNQDGRALAQGGC